MAGIRIVSTSEVHAAIKTDEEEAPDQKIHLTPSDLKLLLLGPIQKGLLFPKPNFPFIPLLKTSLSQTLLSFFPLAGRLSIATHTPHDAVSFSIDCNDAGVLFVHTVADGVKVDDILRPLFVPDVVHSFFPLNGVINRDGVSQPLMGVQVTELVDGVFIGCTMNHSVADGTTFWNFFNTWSETSRNAVFKDEGVGVDTVRVSITPPVFERGLFLDHDRFPIRVPVSNIATEDNFVLPRLLQRVFHFSKEKIAWLKEKANAEAGTLKISSLQSLLAHFWRAMVRNGPAPDPDQDRHLYVHVGIRSRLHPPLPKAYFGNALLTAAIALKAREILEMGLGYAAHQVNKVIASYTEETIRSCLEDWIENPEIWAMSKITNNAVITSSSPRFDVYGNDFGWGRPIAVRSGLGNKFDGKLTLFPGREEGSVDVEVCVSHETLWAMGNDSEFMEAVTA